MSQPPETSPGQEVTPSLSSNEITTMDQNPESSDHTTLLSFNTSSQNTNAEDVAHRTTTSSSTDVFVPTTGLLQSTDITDGLSTIYPTNVLSAGSTVPSNSDLPTQVNQLGTQTSRPGEPFPSTARVYADPVGSSTERLYVEGVSREEEASTKNYHETFRPANPDTSSDDSPSMGPSSPAYHQSTPGVADTNSVDSSSQEGTDGPFFSTTHPEVLATGTHAINSDTPTRDQNNPSSTILLLADDPIDQTQTMTPEGQFTTNQFLSTKTNSEPTVVNTELPDLTTNSIENNTLVQSTGADIWPSTVRNYANTTNNDFLSGLPSSKEEPPLSSPGDVARTDALDLTTRRLLNTEESSTNTLPPAATTPAHYGSTDNNLEVTDVVPGEKWIILVIIAGIVTLVPGQYVKDIEHYCEIGCRKMIYGIQWSSGVQ